MDETDNQSILDMTADIVAAFVSNNPVRGDDLPALIASVHTALSETVRGVTQEAPPPAAPIPAVPVKKSVTDDYLICLEDGKMFKSLKRHLSTAYGMSPDDYRTKWGLSRDYPMVAPGYAATRSALAKAAGLGFSRKRGEPAATPPAPKATVEAAPVAQAPKARAAKAAKPTADILPMAESTAKRRGRPKKPADE